jgi:DNA protecting protein DprA
MFDSANLASFNANSRKSAIIDSDLIKWVRLWLTTKTTSLLTNNSFKKAWIKNNYSIESTFNQIVEDIALMGEIVSEEDAINEIQKINNFGAQIITLNDARYPELLKQLPSAPVLICVKGNTDLLSKTKVAIVGSRNASLASINSTKHFAKELASRGVCIVSGFATGVDTAACMGSIEYGCIQVIATGLDVIYPKTNTKLYQQVLDKGGLFVSEYPMGHNCSRWIGVKSASKQGRAKKNFTNFPERNKIIAGMSHYTIVSQINLGSTEEPLDSDTVNQSSNSKTDKHKEENNFNLMIGTGSGSMNTAYNVLKQGGGRMLFAIPGNPNVLSAKGCNLLIEKKLAHPIFNVNTILEIESQKQYHGRTL